ncbi:MAG: DUF5110 domain-containing protein [Lactobacillales bacterium]|jgi:alpha-glucosidase (family GH31 glycosyl hydrolase)|nr:DUF5110 domain-containing protein [Lactobacillales bacterium]
MKSYVKSILSGITIATVILGTFSTNIIFTFGESVTPDLQQEENKEELSKEQEKATVPKLTKKEYKQLSDQSGLGNVTDVVITDQQITLKISTNNTQEFDYLEINPLENNLLKINLRPKNIENSPATPMVDPNATFSMISAEVNQTNDLISIKTSECTLEISKTPARMTLKDNADNVLLSEPTTGGIFAGGVRFIRGQEDHIYGAYGISFSNGDLGIQRDNTSDANKTVQAGEQGNAGGPFMWSTNGYGILVDSDGGYPFSEASSEKLEFYYGDDIQEGRRYSKENVELYLMTGQPKQIMRAYAKVTGKTPMLPKWGLGFSNFEWGINETEFREMVADYRAKSIPIDSYAFDYDWKFYGDKAHGADYGEFKWNTDNFPSASNGKLKSDMDELGIHMIGITKPRIVTQLEDGTVTEQGQEATANGFFYPGHNPYKDYFIPVTVQSIDPYKAEERQWWWQHSQDSFDKGIAGWWNDETDKVSSGSAQYWFGNFTTTNSSQALYEGQRQHTNNQQRVWQTARTFYPGAQRYATSIWSGDIGVQWEKGDVIDWANGVKEQPSTMLSTINLGQNKWGMDTGGFNANSGQILNPDPELYARWMAFSSLVPIFRVHGNLNQQRQPWYYGSTAEEMAKSSILWRYSMMPYLYTYERMAYDSGVGLVRPLTFDYPKDENVANLTNQWMFGDNFLVAPILEKNQKNKEIYLPEGNWIDYVRGDVYEGNQTIHYSVNTDNWSDTPMFVKQGTITPIQQPQNYTDEKQVDTIYLDTFPTTNQTTFTLYDDDGKTYNYEENDYSKQTLEVLKNEEGTSFTIKGKEGSFQSDTTSYIIQLHGEAAQTVMSNEQVIEQQGSLSELEQSQSLGFAVGKDVHGAVTYVKVPAQSTQDRTIQTSGQQEIPEQMTYEMTKASPFANSKEEQPIIIDNSVGQFNNDGAGVTLYPTVKSQGDYKIQLAYKNESEKNQTLSIFVNGHFSKQTILKPSTDFSEQNENVSLSAGKNVISYQVLEDNEDEASAVKLNKITLKDTPEVIKVEAENSQLSDDLSTNNNHWFYSGTGFVESLAQNNNQLKFNVDIPEEGEYTLNTRVANGTGSTQTIALQVNDGNPSSLSIPSPEQNWNIWKDNQIKVNLQKGKNTLIVSKNDTVTGNVNIDRFLISKQELSGPVESEKNLLDDGNFERTTDQSNNWSEWHPEGQNAAFGVDSGVGTNPPEAAKEGRQRAYFHASSAYKQSIHQQLKVNKDKKYEISAWVKLSNTQANTARMEVDKYDSSNGKYVNIENDGIWHYIKVKDVTVTTGNIDVGFYVDSPGGTTLLMDDVQLIAEN